MNHSPLMGREKEIRRRASKLRGNAAYRAKKKDFPCTLDLEWVVEQITNNRCAATGLPFDLKSDPHRRRT